MVRNKKTVAKNILQPIQRQIPKRWILINMVPHVSQDRIYFRVNNETRHSQTMHEFISTISKTLKHVHKSEIDTYKYTQRLTYATVTQSLKLQSLNQPDKTSRISYFITEYLDNECELL
jgi:hypothetical protein